VDRGLLLRIWNQVTSMANTVNPGSVIIPRNFKLLEEVIFIKDSYGAKNNQLS